MNSLFKEDEHEDEELDYENLLNDANGLRDEEKLIMEANLVLWSASHTPSFSKKNEILSKCMKEVTIALETHQESKVLY